MKETERGDVIFGSVVHFLAGLPCDVKVLITSRFMRREKRINCNF